MERYENIVKIEEIRRLVEDNQYIKALMIIDTMDVGKIKSLPDLSIIADVYTQNDRFDDALLVLTKIYSKNKSRRILYQLVDLSIKGRNLSDAEDYLEAYIKAAPQDSYRYIFRYCIDKLKSEPIDKLIQSLEQLKEYDYIEVWAYELAKLYHKAGMKDKCIRECSDIILWFGDGLYVEKAKLLKAYYVGEINPIHMLKAKEKREAEARLGLDKTKDYSTIRSQIDYYLAEDEMKNSMWEETNPDKNLSEEMYSDEIDEIDKIPSEEISEEIYSDDKHTDETYSEEIKYSEKNHTDESYTDEIHSEEVIKLEESKYLEETNYEYETSTNNIIYETAKNVDIDNIEVDKDLVSNKLYDDVDSKEISGELVRNEILEDIDSKESGNIESGNKEEDNKEEGNKEDNKNEDDEKTRKGDFIHNNTETNSSYSVENTDEIDEIQAKLDVEIEALDQRLDQIFLGTNIDYKKIFGHFTSIKTCREELEVYFENILDNKTRNIHLFITGEEKSGKTTFGKAVIKILNQLNYIKTTRVAIIDGEKLLKINLMENRDKLKNGTLIIENASKLEKESVKQLTNFINDLQKSIFILLEDEKDNMEHLLHSYPNLKTCINNQIHLPKYNKNDLFAFANDYITANDYRLTSDAKAMLCYYIEEILCTNEKHHLKVVMECVSNAILSAEERNKKTLFHKILDNNLDSGDFLYIEEQDFNF